MTRIAIFGECYSDNLGDAAISRSLVALLRDDFGLDARPSDLSGRRAPCKPEIAPSRSARKGMLHIPYSARTAKLVLNWIASARWATASHYKSALEGADYALIGGGQLIADTYLNFPLKLNLLSRVLSEKQVRYSFVSCGAGPLSRVGRQLVRPALERADWIGLRDEDSIAILADQFPDQAHKVILTPDAALAAAKVYAEPSHQGEPYFVLGPIAQRKVERFVPAVGEWSDERYRRFWLSLAKQVAGWGKLTLLSNGESLDNILCVWLQKELEQAGIEAARYIPQDDHDLASVIRGASGMVAARLHASILGVSFGVPCVGIVWDPKVKAFYDLFGAGATCLDFMNEEPSITLPAEGELAQRSETVRIMQARLTEGLAKILSAAEDRSASLL